MALNVSCGGIRASLMEGASPAALLAFVLRLEPADERLEIFDDRGGVHLAGARQLEQGVLPGLALSLRQHRGKARAGFLVAVDRTLAQRTLVSSRLAQGLLELELHDERQEIARVRYVRRDVILRARVEVLFGAAVRRGDALVLAAQFPPRSVVVLGLDLARENLPAPLVDELAEGQEGDLVERHLHLLIDDEFLARLDVADKVDRMQVPRRHRQVDRVADRFVETVVRTALEHVRQVAVPEVVIDVTE